MKRWDGELPACDAELAAGESSRLYRSMRAVELSRAGEARGGRRLAGRRLHAVYDGKKYPRT